MLVFLYRMRTRLETSASQFAKPLGAELCYINLNVSTHLFIFMQNNWAFNARSSVQHIPIRLDPPTESLETEKRLTELYPSQRTCCGLDIELAA